MFIEEKHWGQLKVVYQDQVGWVTGDLVEIYREERE